MNEFIPSPDFVKETMSLVKKIDENENLLLRHKTLQLLATYAGAAGVLLVGIANLIRFLATVYAPVGCH